MGNIAFEVPLHQSHELSPEQIAGHKERIKKLLSSQDAALVAHYYVDGEIQELAEDTGGCVADSLEMARFGNRHSAKTLVVAGVKFMGETAKILNPEKRVLMPTSAVRSTSFPITATSTPTVRSSCTRIRPLRSKPGPTGS